MKASRAMAEDGGDQMRTVPIFPEDSLFFDDFRLGMEFEYHGPRVEAEQIVRFAEVFDPQPMHLDGSSSQAAMTGGMIASGWMTASIHMRMICDAFLLRSSSMGAPGIEELRWLRPVRPGDTLRGRAEVLGVTPSRTRGDRGAVQFRFSLFNQDDTPVMEQRNVIFFARRTLSAPSPSGAASPAETPAENNQITEVSAREYLAEPRVGTSVDLGQHRFTEAEIIDFAGAYDPQSFHVDPSAARASHFGGLIASGWHTGAIWMRRLLETFAEVKPSDTALSFGPSPGFRDLRWAAPVRPGDTLRYRTMMLSLRPSSSKPDLWILGHRNEAVNQNNKRVFSFDGSVLATRK